MGPLAGYRILEFTGIGPGPFCAMMLADMGAEIVRIDRAPAGARLVELDARLDVTARGRKSIALDLKNPEAVAALLRICRQVDVLIEGYRPGVMERLGLGPDACMAANPRLVYGRMTGWGQEGPLSRRAGHDINYLAMSGSLYMMGRAGEPPVAPLNLVADMGGGGMLLAFGIACALLERVRSGRGQVIDAAMVDGSALLATFVYPLKASGAWRTERGSNLLDSGAHFYDVYETRDARYVAVGAIEPQFYALLLERLGLDPAALPDQLDRKCWPSMKRLFAEKFRTRTRDEWERIFEDCDACVTPVLTPEEAAQHPHAVHRNAFRTAYGVMHPASAPRFSRSQLELPDPPPGAGEDSAALLGTLGLTVEEIRALRSCGALG